MNIIGKSECTASQMAQYLINKNPNAKSWALEYAKLYLEEGEIEGVRGDGAWIQSCKETGNFAFTGGTAVTFDQNNFCGLGVTKKGMKGHSFDTPRLGIRAQIQHLKAYATTAPLKNPCIDPRYKYVTKGCAPRFEDLAGKWAVPGYNTNLASSLQDAMNKKIGYGFDIIDGINQMKLIKENNKEVRPMGSNSSLVTYTKISPNRTSPRNHKIDTITIHCIVGQWTAKQGCDYFATTGRSASANYVVGKDGSMGLSVPESDRSWCSSNAANDHRAVTIEVASDTTHPYTITSAAMKALIELCADICKRNGIKKLVWSTNKNERINHLNGCNMTVHRDFASKACPGEYLYSKHGYIANEVNKRLGVATGESSTSTTTSSFIYNGYDYSLVFNPAYYANKYSDLKKAFGTDSKKLFSHFITYGTKEGRIACSGFNVQAYKNRYSDLQKAFGSNLPKYYEHYIKYGFKEKRQAT